MLRTFLFMQYPSPNCPPLIAWTKGNCTDALPVEPYRFLWCFRRAQIVHIEKPAFQNDPGLAGLLIGLGFFAGRDDLGHIHRLPSSSEDRVQPHLVRQFQQTQRDKTLLSVE